MTSIQRLTRALTRVRAREVRPVVACFSMAFLLMASYFVLRPVRDAMASDWTDTEVSTLWNIQFFLSIGIVALYNMAISAMPFRRVIPLVYGGFAASFVGFYMLAQGLPNPTLIEKAFYLWVSAFGLLNVSVFWSFMAQTFTSGQSERLFAIIGAGASLGAIVGPAIPALFASTLGLDALMLCASTTLTMVIPIVLYIQKTTARADGSSEPVAKIDGRWWSGFSALTRSPYLLMIAAFLLLYVFVGSFAYFMQKNILADFTRIERAQILGGIDWMVNTLTFVCAFFVSGRLVGRFGMAMTLALIPLTMILGLFTLSVMPLVSVLLAMQVVRRAGNYAVTRPAREMLFTQVGQQERFKAKPVIDVVVYRGGDAISGSLFAFLTDGIGLGVAIVAGLGAALSAIWAGVGIRLGRAYARMARNPVQPDHSQREFSAPTLRTAIPQPHPKQPNPDQA